MPRINFFDRIPTILGRWAKSNETSTHVTLTRADEPVEEGTPLNGANLNALVQFADLNTEEFNVSGTDVSLRVKPMSTYQKFMTGRLWG